MGESIRRLGRYLEECERTDARVGLCDRCVSAEDGRVRASLELTVSTDRDFGDGVRLDDDGTLALPLDDHIPVDADGVRLDADAVTFADGALTVALTATVAADASTEGTAPAAVADPAGDVADSTGDVTDSDDSTDSDTSADSDGSPDDPIAAARDPSVPPFRDRAYLAAIYDAADTFTEMADVIDMDVTAETVRRYMIQHGVHDPSSYDTSDPTESPDDALADDGTPGDGTDDEGPVIGDALNDGGADDARAAAVADPALPESVTVDDLVDAVERANTIHEVGRAVGLERMDTLDLLQRLDLLEFVMGRLSTEAERDVSREQILECVRHAVAGAGSRAAPS